MTDFLLLLNPSVLGLNLPAMSHVLDKAAEQAYFDRAYARRESRVGRPKRAATQASATR